jgi:hypothetical protein
MDAEDLLLEVDIRLRLFGFCRGFFVFLIVA